MSERKVLNKYYPPDFDPSKIPRMKLPKNRQYTVRLMAPFNMRCATCGEYIYRGKKFNARKEDVEGDDYCGIRIYRFYIKCTRCLQEISFKTDPRNTDYEIEAGATRNFMALKLAQEQEQRAEEELKEEEANNPMKLLESRTQQSKIEIEVMECLEEIKDLNRRHYNIDFNELLKKYNTDEMKEKIQQMQREKDEELAKQLISKKRSLIEEEEEEIEIIEEEEEEEKEDEHNEIKNEIPITFEKKEKPKDKEITSSFDTNATAFSSHNSTLNKFKALAAKKQKSDTSSESSSSKSVTKPKSPEKPKTSALNLLCNYDDSNSDTGSNSD